MSFVRNGRTLAAPQEYFFKQELYNSQPNMNTGIVPSHIILNNLSKQAKEHVAKHAPANAAEQYFLALTKNEDTEELEKNARNEAKALLEQIITPQENTNDKTSPRP